MRERFRQEGLDGFADHEVLELLLFYGRARGDTNALAHELLDAFGSLKGVLEARPEQLMAVKGVGEEMATIISLMLPVFRRYAACVCREKKTITSRTEAKVYCRALLAGWRTERFYVICLGTSNQVLGQRRIAEGSLTDVPAYPRLVAETALNYNAHMVLLCHNHPSGLCEPSPEDLETTRRLFDLLTRLNVVLLDHIIVSSEEEYSMAEHGVISHELGRVLTGSLIPPDGKSSMMPSNRRRKGRST